MLRVVHSFSYSQFEPVNPKKKNVKQYLGNVIPSFIRTFNAGAVVVVRDESGIFRARPVVEARVEEAFVFQLAKGS